MCTATFFHTAIGGNQNSKRCKYDCTAKSFQCTKAKEKAAACCGEGQDMRDVGLLLQWFVGLVGKLAPVRVLSSEHDGHPGYLPEIIQHL